MFSGHCDPTNRGSNQIMSFIKDYFEKQESSSAGSLPVRYEWPRLDLAKESQELHLVSFSYRGPNTYFPRHTG